MFWGSVLCVFALLTATRRKGLVQSESDVGNYSDSMIQQLYTDLSSKYDSKLAAMDIQINSVLVTTNAALKNVEADLQTTNAELNTLKSDLLSKTEQLTNLTLELAKTSSAISFQVTARNESIALVNSDILRLETIIENKGNAFDEKSATFTAPVAGTFLFWVHVFNNDNVQRLDVHIQNERGYEVRGFAPDNLYGGVASATALFHLEKGERVWFRKKGSSNLFGHNLTSYGGVLLGVY